MNFHLVYLMLILWNYQMLLWKHTTFTFMFVMDLIRACLNPQIFLSIQLDK